MRRLPSATWHVASRALRLGVTLLLLSLASPIGSPSYAAAGDPLPSWNDGASRSAILDFVARVTREGGPDFVAVPERIAVFDNDGTLWSEQPIYTQLAFAFDRVAELAPQHPEWKTTQPFKGVLEHDAKAVAASGREGSCSRSWPRRTSATRRRSSQRS